MKQKKVNAYLQSYKEKLNHVLKFLFMWIKVEY